MHNVLLCFSHHTLTTCTLRQEEWNLKHKDKASAASMERVQHFGESFAKIQEATGKLSVPWLSAASILCTLPAFQDKMKSETDMSIADLAPKASGRSSWELLRTVGTWS